MRVVNFSAGPAMLPTVVMERAQAEFCDYKGSGCGVMEHSHRGPLFDEIIARANSNIREILGVSDEYDVVYIQGGASLQFAMIPMNFMKQGGFAQYADTGTWSERFRLWPPARRTITPIFRPSTPGSRFRKRHPTCTSPATTRSTGPSIRTSRTANAR